MSPEWRDVAALGTAPEAAARSFAYTARWRRERDREVGDGWHLPLASVVVQAAAFRYPLRRATTYAGT